MVAVAHYVGTARNYGDLAIFKAMQDLFIDAYWECGLAESCLIDLIPIDLKSGICLDHHIDWINRNTRGLIIGAGGLLMPGDGFQTRSGWQLNISESGLDSLRVPYYLYGIGNNTFPYNTPQFDDRTKDHMIHTLHSARRLSVRDLGTNEYIRTRLGVFGARYIHDPAMFLDIDDTLTKVKHRSLDGKAILGINIPGDRLDQRLPPHLDVSYFLELLGNELQKVLDETNTVILDIPHVIKYDNICVSYFKKRFVDKYVYLPDIMPWLYPESLQCLSAFLSVYRSLDCMVGGRWHSNVIPFSLRIPTIAFGDHEKQIRFSEEYMVPRVNSESNHLAETVLSMLHEPSGYLSLENMLHFKKVNIDEHVRIINGILQ